MTKTLLVQSEFGEFMFCWDRAKLWRLATVHGGRVLSGIHKPSPYYVGYVTGKEELRVWNWDPMVRL